ncbi:MAG: tRNA preQ1(34) S-adenosylmethionine ribosyltransferase-isomerase QueA [bacterium]|jgi:S-adenosylmethionine:tRNA ribosyltransferase-isomerase
MDLKEFDYDLPEELIAQQPVPRRDASRLLVVHRESGDLEEASFAQLPEYLHPEDLLVLNDTRVFPARLFGKKEPGGAAIEMLLLQPEEPGVWEVIAYRASRLKEGTVVRFSDQFSCTVRACLPEGKFRVQFDWQSDWDEVLRRHGNIPLPPYIQRQNGQSREDYKRYQTVFARSRLKYDSAAAPTAGLHFTPELLQRLHQNGIETAYVTLRVGLDTFLPMRVDRVEEHKMHSETYLIPPETVEKIIHAKEQGRRVIAVGTTSVRTLESAARAGTLQPGEGTTELFIFPGYQFNTVNCMITNFHLPKSTLLLLVSAFMGNELRKKVYQYAIEHRYRFFSYGDAMLIL